MTVLLTILISITTTTTKSMLTMALTVAMNDDRRSVWAAHLDFIEQHNQEAARGLHTFTVGVNHFADMVSGLLRGRERGGGGGKEGSAERQTHRHTDRETETAQPGGGQRASYLHCGRQPLC